MSNYIFRSSLFVKPWFVQGWRHFHLINAEMIIWSFCKKKSGHDFRIQLRLCNLWFWIWTFLFVTRTRLDVRYCHFISLFGTPSLFHVNSILISDKLTFLRNYYGVQSSNLLLPGKSIMIHECVSSVLLVDG